MRKLSLLFLVAFGVKAGAATVAEQLLGGLFSPDWSKDPQVMSVFRLTGGYTEGQVSDVKPPDQIAQFDRSKGLFGEVDVGMILTLHFGYSDMTDKEAQAKFDGGSLRDAEFAHSQYQYGLKLVLPIPYVNPYYGVGLSVGRLRLREIGEGATESEHSRTAGTYWHAGLDILFSKALGLRVGYQEDLFKSTPFEKLGGRVEWRQQSGRAGLMLHF